MQPEVSADDVDTDDGGHHRGAATTTPTYLRAHSATLSYCAADGGAGSGNWVVSVGDDSDEATASSYLNALFECSGAAECPPRVTADETRTPTLRRSFVAADAFNPSFGADGRVVSDGRI